MGVRANHILRYEGKNLITYDHYAGQRTGRDVMYRAMFSPLEFPIGLETGFHTLKDAVMPDPWSEGAILLDLDARRCVFFGGDGTNDYRHYYDPVLRTDVLRLLQRRLDSARCDPWRLEWAMEGAWTIETRLGAPPTNVAATADQKRPLGPPRKSTSPIIALTRKGAGVRDHRMADYDPSHSKDPSDCLLPLAHGPRGVLETRWNSLPPFDLARARTAVAGIVIDEDDHTLRFWHGRPETLGFIRAAWPDWAVAPLHGGLAEQLDVPAPITALDDLLRYFVDVITPQGSFEGAWLREALCEQRCSCDVVLGYGDAPLEELFRRFATEPPRTVPEPHTCDLDGRMRDALALR